MRRCQVYEQRVVCWWLCSCVMYLTWYDYPSLADGESHGILLLQKQQKVGRAPARQIVVTRININTCAEGKKPYTRYIDVEIDPCEKRKLCPFKWKKKPLTELNIAATQISGNKKGCTIRSHSEEVCKKGDEMKTVMGLTCTVHAVQDHQMFNKSKRLI